MPVQDVSCIGLLMIGDLNKKFPLKGKKKAGILLDSKIKGKIKETGD